MDGRSADALLQQLLDEAIGTTLGPHEDQGALRASADGGGNLHLVELVHEQEAVRHLLDGDRGRDDLVEDRILQVPAHDMIDRTVERRGEQAASGAGR